MIRFEHVTKVFGSGKRVLDDVSYEVERGEIFTIVGPSGTGKSVSLKHMIRLLTPTSGRVWVGDDCVSEAEGRELSRIRSRFGYLFQSAALLAWMDVYDNVALPLREKTRLTEGEIERKVRDPVTSRRIDELIADLSSRLGITSVVVTHDLHSALAISTRIAMLGGGKVLSIEPPSAFIHSTLPQARAFLEAQYITRRGAWEANRP